MKLFHKATVFIAFIAFQQCTDPNLISKQYINVSQEVWEWDEPKTFTFEVLDAEFTYNQYLHLRLTDDYPKSNIYIKSYLIYAKDTAIELHNLNLFSPEGKALGKRGSKFITYRLPIALNQALKKDTTYTMVLEQHTREFELSGVNAVGFEVEKGDPVF